MVTGFQSPAMGYEEKTINLNTLLVKNPHATAFMKIDSDNYARMGIYSGDLLIVDRAKAVEKSSLVVYEKDGEFVLGRVSNIHSEVNITGVIVYIIHTVKEPEIP